MSAIRFTMPNVRQSDPPTVTVGLPTYNRCAGLARAARSVLAQEGVPIELVISDNASTDDTSSELDLLASDPAVVILRQEQNRGPTPNFRATAAVRRGEHFMWLGDDDWLDPGYIAACVDALRSDPSLSLVAGRARYHEDGRTWCEPKPIRALHADPRRRVTSYYRKVGANGVFYGVARGECFDRLPPVPDLMGGDWLHVAALAFLGRVCTIDGPEVHRTTGGATRSLADVARHLGLGWFSRMVPQLVLAWNVFRDIAWRSPVYASLGVTGRLILATRAFTICCVRFFPVAALKVARRNLRPQRRRVVAESPSGSS